MPRIPDVFIVGAPKAGTTSLHRYLQEHPEVFMSRMKEPGYFAPDVTGTRREHPFRHPADEAAYLALFEAAGEARRVGESSTSYLMSELAPSLIKSAQPEAAIIVMLRHPVELMYSLHGERVSDGAEWIADFEEALAADADRRAGARLPHGLSGRGVAYRDNALLGEQLQRWLEHFGPQRVHAIVFDDFARDPEREYAKVLEFLGVDAGFRPESFAVYNPSHRRRGGLAGLLRNRFTRWVSRRVLPAAIGDARTTALARRFGLRRMTRRRYERPPLPAEVRTRLAAEFSADVELLGRLIGRDLGAEWLAPSRVADAAA